MAKTLIGIVSYGGLPFLRILLDQIRATATLPVDVLVIVAKHGDEEMKEDLRQRGITFIEHQKNFGFPASVNDLYDAAFKSDYDLLIVCGNDTVPMPGCIDAMIRCAESTDWETVSATEFDSRSLVATYPEAEKYFKGQNYRFTDFTSKPWELHKHEATGIQPDCFKDVRNMTLYKRSVFEKTGYADANFWPNGYFEDNDIVHRCVRSGIKSAGLLDASFFHFWSRTIHQGESRPNNVYFERNRAHYILKWGGEPYQEKYELPFRGDTYQLAPNIFLKGNMKIDSRENEKAIVNYWSRK